MKQWLTRTALIALLLTGAGRLSSFLLPTQAAAPSGAEEVGYSLLANAMAALVLLLLGQRYRGGAGKTTGLLWLVWFGIQAANLVEALFFGLDLPRSEAWRHFLEALLISTIGAVAAEYFAVPGPSGPLLSTPAVTRSWASWMARLAACDVAYIFAYFTAGILAFPFVQEFYATRPVPSPAAILQMQLVRGLVFSLLVLMIVRGLAGSRRRAAVLAGLTLAVLGGVHPLLPPNPYLPGYVRAVHLVEVALSNFLFGWFAGWLLGSAPAAAPPAEAAPSPAGNKQ